MIIARSAAELIWRDLAELAGAGSVGTMTVLFMIAALPVSLILASKGFRSGWVAAGLSAFMWGLWWFAYSTDFVPNLGLRAVLVPVGLTLAAWAVLAVSTAWRVVRRRAPQRGLDSECERS